MALIRGHVSVSLAFEPCLTGEAESNHMSKRSRRKSHRGEGKARRKGPEAGGMPQKGAQSRVTRSYKSTYQRVGCGPPAGGLRWAREVVFSNTESVLLRFSCFFPSMVIRHYECYSNKVVGLGQGF